MTTTKVAHRLSQALAAQQVPRRAVQFERVARSSLDRRRRPLRMAAVRTGSRRRASSDLVVEPRAGACARQQSCRRPASSQNRLLVAVKHTRATASRSEAPRLVLEAAPPAARTICAHRRAPRSRDSGCRRSQPLAAAGILPARRHARTRVQRFTDDCDHTSALLLNPFSATRSFHRSGSMLMSHSGREGVHRWCARARRPAWRGQQTRTA